MVMALAITPLHPHIGAMVGGLDVSRPIDDATVDALWRAIDRHAVLVFRDQQITDEQLRAFAARFGELEIGRSAARGGRRRLSYPEIGDISNLDEDSRLRARDDRKRLDSLGNRLWHTDASYMPVPVVLGMLFAVAVPPASPFGAGGRRGGREAGQWGVAHRCVVQGGAGRAGDAGRGRGAASVAVRRRGDRVCRDARRLRRAVGRAKGGELRARRRARGVLPARPE